MCCLVNNLTVTIMVSRSFPILSLVSKEYHFEHFQLKSPVIIEIAGLRLLMSLLKEYQENHKRTETVYDFG